MRKMLIAAVLLVGCSGDDGPPADPHEAMECDEASWGYPYASCEAACVTKENDGGPWCDATLTVPGLGTGEIVCGENLTTFDGVRGCCANPADADGIRRVFFAVCNP